MNTEISPKKSVKVAISLRADLIEWVDEKAHEMGLSRSGYLAMCITQYKQALEVQPQLNNLMGSLSNVMNGLANGTLTVDQAQMRLVDIESQYPTLKK
jgi:hypothetical protein